MRPSARHRPMSPGNSLLIDPMRASTGTVQLNSSYDPYDSSAGRLAYAGYRSDVPYLKPSDPRYTRETRLEAQPVSTQTYREHGQPAKLRTEYAILARPRSSTTSTADSRARLDVPASSPISRGSPVIMSDYGRSPSPLTGKDGYLVPASSHKHHRRHRHSSSVDYASDTGRDASRTYEHSGRRRYPQTGGLRRGEDIDDYDAYSYTNPREQFEKESIAKLRYNQGGYPKERRPLSLTGIDDPNLMIKKESRALGPPPAHRGFEKLDGDEMRRSTFGSAHSELDLAGTRQRPSPRSITLHQDHDEGYSSYRDDYEDTRHLRREHKRPDGDARDRQGQDDRTSKRQLSKVPAAPGPSNGLGTAVLASGYSDDLDFDLRSRGDRYRSRDLVVRDQSRSRRQSRRRVDSDSDAYSSDDDLKKYRREPSVHPKTTNSDSSRENDRPHRHSSRSRHQGQVSKELKSIDYQKRPEQGTSKDVDTQPPKGILKPPRDKFPEEPNPVREGVAPLKDAHKKGIPPGARWTKIDRRLVNPAALEESQERFEERPEYVIVLRVLTKEEIQAYAVKTQEIRDARYHEYIHERRRRREEDRRRGRPIDDFSSDDEDDGDDSPLAIDTSAESKPAPRSSAGAAEQIRS
ncbi:hypothetical protein P175DRAFT_0426423 [Aspergillus ochraceoroseus IBT 24754]|uniref:DUF8035 domain-containing protein n=3 Tax=Aspergillus subgen. Nidulantes TaxID=2720870 RepID=A0A0F8V1T4_9EURO|nr:uncharacterized protein P175DRAFT_0426423 [Aspergillus ochraceoroseus IBT 24754]KKK17393.1 hypothetical protein AOCH_007619 [Aspergillus ochraceoroseus]KKK25703.1 hypothetical protein ARAM_006635 [Aspergillus rambellii]PTU25263.1 hypothetical protein P175DRAFT_0426423 [Aspergillus ochraceoroseus IBT 24754]